ncbi:MAG: hypothetical protein ACOYL6_05585 [Bacteriovoracaceae bacterium]
MSLILLLSLSLVLNAQVSGVKPSCEVKDSNVEKQCLLDMCAPGESSAVNVFTSDQFMNEVNNYKYTLPANIETDLDAFATSMEQAIVARDKLFSEGPDKVADKILSHLDGNVVAMESLFSDKFNVYYSKGEAQIVMSNVNESENSLYGRLAKSYKSLMEISLGYRFRSQRLVDPKSDVFFSGICQEMAENFKISNPIKAKELEVLRSKFKDHNGDPALLLKEMDQLFNQKEFYGMLTNKFQSMKPDLTLALTDRMNQSKKRPFDKEKLKYAVKNTCKVSNFMLEKIVQQNPQAQFVEAQKQIVNLVKSKFIPQMSEHSGQVISEALNQNPFQILTLEKDIHPPYAALNKGLKLAGEGEDVVAYMNTTQFMTQNSDKFLCSTKSVLPSDHYDGTKIVTSAFTLGMEYNDILAHELGHWLSDKMARGDISVTSKAKIVKVRTCITGFYQNNTLVSSNKQFEGDGFRTEEDFADWFSASLNVSPVVSFCDFPKLFSKLSSYLPKQWQNTEKNGDYLPDSNDNHSNNLFRVLHNRLVSGRSISASCKTLMEEHPEAAPKKCDI